MTFSFSELTYTCSMWCFYVQMRENNDKQRAGHIGLWEVPWYALMALMECAAFIGAIKAQRTSGHGIKLLLKKGNTGCFRFQVHGSPKPMFWSIRSETYVVVYVCITYVYVYVMFSLCLVNEACSCNLWDHWELQQLNMTGTSEHSGGLGASVYQNHSALARRGR